MHDKKTSRVIVAPYAENGPGVMSAMDDTGYTLARSKFDDIDYVSPLQRSEPIFYAQQLAGKSFATMPVTTGKKCSVFILTI